MLAGLGAAAVRGGESTCLARHLESHPHLGPAGDGGDPAVGGLQDPRGTN